VGTRLRVELIDIGGGVMRSVLTDSASGGEVQAEVMVAPATAASFTEMRIKRARYTMA